MIKIMRIHININIIKLSLACVFYFWSFQAVAQKAYVVSKPFPNHFFIQNNGQWNHLDSNIGFILWNDVHNISLSKKQAGFTWDYFSVPLKKEGEKKASQKITPIQDRVQQVFLNSNPNPQIIIEKASDFYWTYGPEEWNSKGFQKVTYKNVYPFIDVYYESFDNPSLGHFKYGFVLHPGANVNDIQMQFVGAKTIPRKNNNHLLKAKHFGLLDSGWSAMQNDKIVACRTQLKNNVIQIKLNGHERVAAPIIIDPYVKVIDSLIDFIVDPYRLYSNLVYHMDFDNQDNAYVMSCASQYPEIAKYDSTGKLNWVFSGQLPSIGWYSTATNIWIVGAMLVDKSTNSIYMSQGFQSGKNGPETVRINSNGNYDNYLAYGRADAPEVWDLNMNCNFNKIIASGGGINEPLNLFMLGKTSSTSKPPKFRISDDSMTTGQDIIRSVIDENNHYFVLLNSWQFLPVYDQNGYAVGNKAKKYIALIWANDSFNKPNYTTELTDYFKFQEAGNSIVPMTNNRFNGLAVNDSLIFAYDGKVLAAMEKYTGKILCIDSVSWHGGKRGHLGQSGIAVDRCNHVFVGGDSANVLVYSFQNKQFKLDSNIHLFSPSKKRRTMDIRLNPLNNQIFVSGDSFTAYFTNPYANSCSVVRTFEIKTKITSPCKGNFIAEILDADSQTDYTFQWTNLTAKKRPVVQTHSGVGLFRDTLFYPKAGDTFELLVAKNFLCNGEYQKALFTTGIVNRREIFDTLCAGQSFAIREHKIFRDSVFSDTLINRYQCDSAVTYHITFKDSSRYHQKVTLCRGDTLRVGKNIYTVPGFYKDTLLNAVGCDSFVYSEFSIAKDTVRIKEHVCNTFFYKVGDSAFYKPGLYTVVMTGSQGCDSVVLADISMSRDTAVRIRPNICDGDTFFLLGLRYTLSGNFQTQLPRVDGCDSIIRLTLNVRSHHWIDIDTNICWGDSVSVGNRVYKKSGIYRDSLKSVFGCDSVINTTVVVNPTFDTARVFILCGDSSVTINNNTYTQSASFNFKHKSSAGCDSLVRYRIIKTNLEPNFSIDTSELPEFTLDNLSVDAIKYIWSFDDGYLDSVNSNITYKFNKSDQIHRICLKVIDSVGCTDSLCINVPASQFSFDLYNSFSPNNDGFNDRFVIKSQGQDLQYSIMIFNRWGAKVYDAERAWTSDPQYFWNGRVMNVGPDCPSGSYFVLYSLYLDGPDSPPTQLHGAITLLR